MILKISADARILYEMRIFDVTSYLRIPQRYNHDIADFSGRKALKELIQAAHISWRANSSLRIRAAKSCIKSKKNIKSA